MHLWLFLCLLFFALSFSGTTVSSETHFPSKGILLPNNVVCLFSGYGRPESQMVEKKKGKKGRKKKVTAVIINIAASKNLKKEGKKAAKAPLCEWSWNKKIRHFYQLVSCRVGGLRRCSWKGSPPYSPRTAHPASPWSWTLESCFSIFQRTLPQSLCPLLSLFSVKHIYSMTSQVYPSCEPSAPFFGSQ